jgi:hypothetical protein
MLQRCVHAFDISALPFALDEVITRSQGLQAKGHKQRRVVACSTVHADTRAHRRNGAPHLPSFVRCKHRTFSKPPS